ncbi:pre-mRNA cleavage complex ii [Anaeramoeba flamelloides]|uniref:Pre-mRNA cleavage complex ii n=1 Tax=Anaeramoeba flamelloides TaxID=1746091 RepID=A0ABQ8YZE6_9EUKA|nr:pre-mRNA cleavage complex ii [Anaeramoeba flamelloides]
MDPHKNKNHFLQLYNDSLQDLIFNEYSQIQVLTDLASENIMYAEDIVRLIINRIKTAKQTFKILALYVLDHILKTIGKQYIGIIQNKVHYLFYLLLRNADHNLLLQLRELVKTWVGSNYFTKRSLGVLNQKIKKKEFELQKPSRSKLGTKSWSKKKFQKISHPKGVANCQQKKKIFRLNNTLKKNLYSNNNRQKDLYSPTRRISKGSQQNNQRKKYPQKNNKVKKSQIRTNSLNRHTRPNYNFHKNFSPTNLQITNQTIKKIPQQQTQTQTQRQTQNNLIPFHPNTRLQNYRMDNHSFQKIENFNNYPFYYRQTPFFYHTISTHQKKIPNQYLQPNLTTNINTNYKINVLPKKNTTLSTIITNTTKKKPREYTLNDYDFSKESLNRKDNFALEILYTKMNFKCSNCGLRFQNEEKLQNHYDWHFKINVRNNKENITRNWFLNNTDWNSDLKVEISEKIETSVLEINDKNSQFKDSEINCIQDDDQYQPFIKNKFPSSCEGINQTCCVCKSQLIVDWNDEKGWIYKDTVELNDQRLVCKLCVRDAITIPVTNLKDLLTIKDQNKNSKILSTLFSASRKRKNSNGIGI